MNKFIKTNKKGIKSSQKLLYILKMHNICTNIPYNNKELIGEENKLESSAIFFLIMQSAKIAEKRPIIKVKTPMIIENSKSYECLEHYVKLKNDLFQQIHKNYYLNRN